MTIELTQLIGTDKQVAFANELRETFLVCWLGEEDKIVNQFGDRGEPGVGKDIVSKVGAEAQSIFDAMAAETSAKTWLEVMHGPNGSEINRSNTPGAMKQNVLAVLRSYKRHQLETKLVA